MGKKYLARPGTMVIASLGLVSLVLALSLGLPLFLTDRTGNILPALLSSIFVLVLLDAAYLSLFKVQVHLGSALEIRAPLWRRDIAYSDIVAVQTEEDSGLNSGAVNWPVAKTAQGYRVNMGGKFRVSLTVKDGSAYEVVMKDQAQALDLVQTLEQVRKDNRHTTV